MTSDAAAAEIAPLSRDVRVRAAAYVGVLAAYVAAVKSDPLTPYQLLFFALAAAWSLGFEHRFRKPFFSPPLKIGLIVVGSGLFVYIITQNVGSPGDYFANTIANFLFWNAIVFILSRNKSEYDLWTMAIIELSLFMISGAFVQPPDFVPLLLLSAACFLYVFQRAALLRCGPAGWSERGGLGLAAFTFFLALEVGVLVFVAFPRRLFRGEKPSPAEARPKPLPPEGEPVASTAQRTGIPKFPQFLTLTQFEKLKIDPRPVLKIRVTDGFREDKAVPPEETPYLRGAVLDTYQNGRWQADFAREPRRDADDGRRNGWTPLGRDSGTRLLVRQHIKTSALSEDLSFCLGEPVRVAWPEAKYDPAGIVFFARIPRDKIEYDIISAIPPPFFEELREVEAPAEPPARYLQLPPGLARLRSMARSQTKDLKNLVHGKAARLRDFLLKNYSYKLNPFVPTEGMDAVEYFLFEKREGYCIHFASALALLCRAAGVPARVATGFQLHSPDETGAFLVKSSDAHAWVEVWFGPEHGWRPYDATPEAGRGAALPPEGAPVATVERDKKAESLSGPAKRWDHFIVEFDPQSQGEAAREALGALVGAAAAVGGFLLSPGFLLALAGAGAAAMGIYLLLPSRQRARLRQIVSGFRERTSVDFYRDFLWALARRGFRKLPALTAREFARQVRASLADPGVDFVTEKFYEVRYRGDEVSAEDRRNIDEAIERLRRTPPPAAAPGGATREA